MLTHREHAAVQQQACQALANLTRDIDGMRVKIAESGGIVSVVAAMSAHKTSAAGGGVRGAVQPHSQRRQPVGRGCSGQWHRGHRICHEGSQD